MFLSFTEVTEGYAKVTSTEKTQKNDILPSKNDVTEQTEETGDKTDSP